MSDQDLLLKYGDEALDNIKTEMGERWDTLTDLQKRSAERSSKRLVELELQKRNGEDVDEDLEFVKTTVRELKLMLEITVADLFWDAFWKGVNKALAALATFLVSAGKASLGVPALDLGIVRG